MRRDERERRVRRPRARLPVIATERPELETRLGPESRSRTKPGSDSRAGPRSELRVELENGSSRGPA
ncbi:hypothetical protein EVAR_61471_1 [Eumeta japonica]|uniref:Uncharacterized protein n=1 Tax=Eumeta variegata TaxID=151549 RepID=A0A4C1Z4N5_EUMVA|nr:hypothetical protein EVAR_61471_1 [Eumeta japonica]